MTILLILVCSLTLVAGLAGRLVWVELTAQREAVRRKQLSDMAWGALRCALYLERQALLKDDSLPEVLLYPGNQPARADWTIKRNPLVGWRYLHVTAKTEDQVLGLSQIRLDFQNQLQALAAKHVLIAGDTIEGGEGVLDPSLYTSNVRGAGLTDFSEADFTDLPKTSFPSAEILQRYGLGGRFYLNTSSSKTVMPGNSGVVIKGSGVLLFRKSLEISPNTTLEDRVIIYAAKNVTIREQVKLKKVLIICKGDVVVGDNCFVQGTIVAQGKIVLGKKAQLVRDAGAASTFYSVNFLAGT